jgi:hypothetical protein
MAAVGRILQIIGWLWFIAGIVGPIFDFESVNPFPGLVLIFVARVFRTRARSEMPQRPADTQMEPQPQPVETARPEPRQPTPPPAAPKPTEPRSSEAKSEPKQERPVEERNQLLERIALAARETAEEPAVPELEKQSTQSKEREPTRPEEVRAPMSSAEMIARARQRWDREKQH